MVTVGRIPDATVARLPLYLRGLEAAPVGVGATVSSDELADLAGVNAAKVRKDLSYLGTYGTRGVGYDADFLRFQISRALGVANTWPVVVCGMGNLGRALAIVAGFAAHREGMVHRPLMIGDWAWSRGIDPALILLALAALRLRRVRVRGFGRLQRAGLGPGRSQRVVHPAVAGPRVRVLRRARW